MILDRWFASRSKDRPHTTPSALTSESIQHGKTDSLSKDDEKLCQNMLKECEMFHLLSGNQLETLAKNMRVVPLKRNEVFVNQGSPVTSFYLLKDGEIRREFLDPDTGQKHTIEFEMTGKSINTMRVLNADLAQATIKCNHNTCTLYEMPREKLMKVLLNEQPDVGVAIANSLTSHIQETSKKYRTPLLEQKQQIIQNMPAVMIAAGIESYYRSALNAQVNRALTGIKADLFPNMHIQVPMRIAYIAGFKGLRAYMDRLDDDETADIVPIDTESENDVANRSKFWRRLGITIAPGIIMTPLSSVLEASNAGHMNKEPMATRWMRGITARCGREIIFGLGLNQLSDYFQERFRYPDSPMLSNMMGSIMGGVVSGYLSHVPHNISTYKLLEPHRSYTDLYKNVFVERSVPPFLERYLTQQVQMQGNGIAVGGAVNYSGSQQAVRFIAATIFPRGLMVRTVQIVGSFIILNGTINYFTMMQLQQ
jgi:CRP-like cAMP-binding protein